MFREKKTPKLPKSHCFFFQTPPKWRNLWHTQGWWRWKFLRESWKAKGSPINLRGGVMAAIMFRGRSDSSTRRTSKKTNQNTWSQTKSFAPNKGFQIILKGWKPWSNVDVYHQNERCLPFQISRTSILCRRSLFWSTDAQLLFHTQTPSTHFSLAAA